jgi:hypothetical protein
MWNSDSHVGLISPCLILLSTYIALFSLYCTQIEADIDTPPMNYYVEPSVLSQHVTEKWSLGCRCGVCKNA